jgi:hypothetical protein
MQQRRYEENYWESYYPFIIASILTIFTHIVKADRQTSTEQDLNTKSFWLLLLTTSLLWYHPKKLHTLLQRRLSSYTVTSSGSVKSSEFNLLLTTQVGTEVIYHMLQTDHLKYQDHIREFLIVLGIFWFHMLFLFTAHLNHQYNLSVKPTECRVWHSVGLAQQQPHHLMDVLRVSDHLQNLIVHSATASAKAPSSYGPSSKSFWPPAWFDQTFIDSNSSITLWTLQWSTEIWNEIGWRTWQAVKSETRQAEETDKVSKNQSIKMQQTRSMKPHP